VDRRVRHPAVPVAYGDNDHVAFLARVHRRLPEQRDFDECRRLDRLAGTAHGASRLLSSRPAGLLRADQANRVSARPDSRSHRKRRRAEPGGAACRRAPQAAGSLGMIEFLSHNMAPLMFGALVIFLLIGYPVAFALAAIGIFFGLAGIELGLLQTTLFQALPQRIWAVMSNDTLLAVPFFTFMGLILERSGMAEDLLDTIGQVFGPLRGGLALAVIVVGALPAATTGVVAASVS